MVDESVVAVDAMNICIFNAKINNYLENKNIITMNMPLEKDLEIEREKNRIMYQLKYPDLDVNLILLKLNLRMANPSLQEIKDFLFTRD